MKVRGVQEVERLNFQPNQSKNSEGKKDGKIENIMKMGNKNQEMRRW